VVIVDESVCTPDYAAALTCVAAPNVVLGTYQGRGFYFRARHGAWSLYRLDSSDGVVQPSCASGVSERAGWWTEAEVLPLCEALVRACF